MRSNKIERYKKRLTLTKRQKQILIGTLLGDGHWESSYREEVARLKIEHSYKQKEYVDWLYKEFQEWSRSGPKIRVRERWGKTHKHYYFTTLSHPELAKFRKLFYTNKTKVIPKELLKYHLNKLSLAVWFMDDGSIKSKECRGRFLNTQSYSEKEVKSLQKILKEKFSLDSSLKKDGNGMQIYIPSNSAKILRQLIDKYVIQSMRYKLPN